MSTDTAIIACAGRGSRLGHNIPKSCVEVGGKTLLQWQLEALEDMRHVVVVVGYRRNFVIDELLSIRNRVTLVLNEKWNETNTAYSISLACQLYDRNKKVLTIDGDTLFSKDDVKNMLIHEDAIGITTSTSSQGVFVQINKSNYVTKFTRETITGFEWSGMALVPSGLFHELQNCFVYQILEKYLPIPAQKVNLVEIDTPDDLEKARIWIKGKNGLLFS